MNDLLVSMRKQFTLLTIRGIPVRADLRWIFVLVLMTGITAASSYFLVKDVTGSIFLGLAATLLFFASVLFHELAHAMVARLEGLNVIDVVLHPFGGLSRFAQPPQTARAEFLIALAGPAASLLIAAALAGLAAGSNAFGWDVVTLALAMLALSNFLIALVNMLPGYPLDGGRVLRAFLWKQGRDLDEATMLTGRFGQVIGVAAIVIGLVFFVLRGEIFTGFWIVLIGIFLLDSATAIMRELRSEQFLAVGNSAVLSYTLSPDVSIQTFIDQILPLHRHTVFAVVTAGRFDGLFVLDDLNQIAQSEWRKATIGTVMRPAGAKTSVFSDVSVAEARTHAERQALTALGVIGPDELFIGLFRVAGHRKSS